MTEETFEMNGKVLEYPFDIDYGILDANKGLRREEYKAQIFWKEHNKKLKEQDDLIPTKYKVMETLENFGREVLASSLEAITCFINLGHTVRFDEIRDGGKKAYQKFMEAKN